MAASLIGQPRPSPIEARNYANFPFARAQNPQVQPTPYELQILQDRALMQGPTLTLPEYLNELLRQKDTKK